MKYKIQSATSSQKDFCTCINVAPIWFILTKPSIADVTGMNFENTINSVGITSFGQINPGKNISGTDENTRINIEYSLFLQIPPIVWPKQAVENKNGTKKSSKTIILWLEL